MSERIERDFSARDKDEQDMFLKQTWCQSCGKADLGMNTPVEYAIEETIFITGKCNACGSDVTTELSEDDGFDEDDSDLDDDF